MAKLRHQLLARVVGKPTESARGFVGSLITILIVALVFFVAVGWGAQISADVDANRWRIDRLEERCR